jgi:hypothetical protein
VRLGRHDFDLAGLAHGMVFERLFLQILAHLGSFPRASDLNFRHFYAISGIWTRGT